MNVTGLEEMHARFHCPWRHYFPNDRIFQFKEASVMQERFTEKDRGKKTDEGGKERMQCFSISHPCNWRNNLQCCSQTKLHN